MLPLGTGRAAAIAQARAALARQPVYLDTETTGLDPAAEIIEIAVLAHDGRPLIDTLIKPLAPIPADATRVHGLTNAMTAGAPSWKEAWPAVAAALKGRLVAIYNMDYDRRLMRQSHRLSGLRWANPKAEYICIMEIYAQFHGEWNRRRGEYRFQRLEEAGRQCQLGLPNSHRARGDAELARAVLEYVAAQPV
jgi:DNA polymerase III subunit epsilon